MAQDVYEQIKTVKTQMNDLMDTVIGCVSQSLVDTEVLRTLLAMVDDLPTAPPAELQQAHAAYALFQQVCDAHEAPEEV